MERTLLVGFGTKARQGKDWLAQYCLEQLAPAARKYALADSLKSFCRAVGWMTKKNGSLLQIVGTEIFRDCVASDHWIHVLKQRILEDDPPVAFITDVRYPNEREWIEEEGGFVVKVMRLNADGTPYQTGDRSSAHRSETALENAKFSHVVAAESGDLAALERGGDRVVAHIKELLVNRFQLGLTYLNFPRARTVLGTKRTEQ